MLRLTEYPGTIPNPRAGESGQPDTFPEFPHLCCVEYQERPGAPWYRVAYGSKEANKPLNVIDTFVRGMSQAQVDEIADWFTESTGWTPSSVNHPRLVDVPKVKKSPDVFEYTPEENAADAAALEVDGVPDADSELVEGVDDVE